MLQKILHCWFIKPNALKSLCNGSSYRYFFHIVRNGLRWWRTNTGIHTQYTKNNEFNAYFQYFSLKLFETRPVPLLKTSDVTSFLHSSVGMCGLAEHTNGSVLACSVRMCVSVCVMVVSGVIQGSVEPVAEMQAS